jgi:hypothetical protein
MELPKSARPRKQLKDQVPSAVHQKSRDLPSRTTGVTQEEAEKPLGFFISHSKDDGDFAENLKFTLEKEGFFGWIDADVLEAGTDWR